jgi:hypothetical protein
MLALGIKGVGSAGIEIGVAEIEGAGVEKVFGRNSLSPSVVITFYYQNVLKL